MAPHLSVAKRLLSKTHPALCEDWCCRTYSERSWLWNSSGGADIVRPVAVEDCCAGSGGTSTRLSRTVLRHEADTTESGQADGVESNKNGV